MQHRTEDRDGIHIIEVSGKITATESRENFRFIADRFHRGPALILVAYGQDCRFLVGPRETLQLHLAVAESMKKPIGGALAFLCPNDALFGICRQLQLLASGSRIKMGVFRDGPQAKEWLAYARQDAASETVYRT